MTRKKPPRPHVRRPLALAAALALALLAVPAPAQAHYCRADEGNPSDCYAPCTPGEYHDHFVDEQWPQENYQCQSEESNPGGPAQCDDGVDNDADGLTDAEDPDCESTEDNWESGSVGNCRILETEAPNVLCDLWRTSLDLEPIRIDDPLD